MPAAAPVKGVAGALAALVLLAGVHGRAESTPVSQEVARPMPAPGSAPVRVGSDVRQPKKIIDVPPVYPPGARAAGIQGIVIIEATIDATGHVTDTRVLRGEPALNQAAIDAVRQWQYEPTTFNGTT